jgi:hypothetical protein
MNTQSATATQINRSTPDNVQLTVFADCKSDEQRVISRKIRKNSKVSIIGKLQSFGALAVCLSDCRLQK